MGFQQGLSGLNAAAKNLDAIGNNVANANTVGFKTSQVQFADVYAASLSGGGAGQIGLGTKTASVTQQFTQGNISSTNNPLDVAINGGGFFRLDTNGTISYTRNGQFQLNKDGFIVTANGSKVTGYGVDATSGSIVATNPAPVSLPTSDLPPQATGGSASAAGAKMAVNLDSREALPVNTTFNPLDPTSYNRTTPITIYDTLGNPHVLSIYFTKTAVAGTWGLNGNVDGADLGAPADAATVGTQTSSLGTDGTTGIEDAAVLVVAAGTYPSGSAPTVAAQAVIDAAIVAKTTGDAVTAAGAGATAAQISAATTAARNVAAAAAVMNAAVIDANAAIATPPGPSALQLAAATAVATAFPLAQAAAEAAFIPFVTLNGHQGSLLKFDTSGKLTTAMPLTISLDLAGVSTALGTTNSAATPLAFNLDFTGTSQYGSVFGVNALTQDGFSSGRLNGFNVGSDGVVQGRYSNGQSRSLGQIVLANFTNPNGLKPLGNNQWAETPDSNQPLIGTPGSGSLGVMQSAAVEESNVDLTAELVNMITAQRVYQANAQSIKTQDSIMQTIVNLR